jgi:hypothetical protein
MPRRNQLGQANLTAVLTLVGLIVASVWVWKRIPPETQDYLLDNIVPIAFIGLLFTAMLWTGLRAVRRHRHRRHELNRLLVEFEREQSAGKRRELAFALIETNRYRLEGLERAMPALADVLMATLKTALGDKQHRIRGMAASYLGALQDKRAIPLLLASLQDDHAYVRACAALGLGRMRALEAKPKLTTVMEEDWDQTVRSRAREALERIGT